VDGRPAAREFDHLVNAAHTFGVSHGQAADVLDAISAGNRRDNAVVAIVEHAVTAPSAPVRLPFAAPEAPGTVELAAMTSVQVPRAPDAGRDANRIRSGDRVRRGGAY
jgi:hypothetical protein